MRANVCKIILVVYTVDKILCNYSSNSRENTNDIHYVRSKTGIILNRKNSLNATSLALSITVKLLKKYKCDPIKYITVSTRNKYNTVGILTIKDQVIQELFKVVIEPAIDVKSDSNSYGFRKGRTCHQALALLQQNLRLCLEHKAILKYDINNFSSHIKHD